MSNSISAMPKDIVKWLNEQTEVFGEISFLTEFPPRPKATPLKNPIISVGLDSVKISDFFKENSEGELVPDEYCRLADIRLRFSIHVPYSMGGTACHDAFTRTIDCLSFKSDLNLVQSGCEAIVADRETDAFVMKSWADVQAQFCPAESSEVQYEAFLPKTFFCASHINDTSLHVSAEEKARWNSTITVGTYFGTGEASRSIKLGFRPSAVIVIPSLMPMFYTATGASYCLSGVAAQSFATSGLSINDSGFTIKQGTSENCGDTYVLLNKTNVDYCYIALK
ncbi:MAG: hypothetical protein IJN81_09605 [Clostridia bacterium]|nr:hypothetical protein [Clostridia bacterium]